MSPARTESSRQVHTQRLESCEIISREPEYVRYMDTAIATQRPMRDPTPFLASPKRERSLVSLSKPASMSGVNTRNSALVTTPSPNGSQEVNTTYSGDTQKNVRIKRYA